MSEAGIVPARHDERGACASGAAHGAVAARRRLVRRLGAHRSVLLGGAVVAALVLMAMLAPAIAPTDPVAVHLADVRRPPSPASWLGTDVYGRDMLSRIIFGARISMVLGASAVLISAAAGGVMGLVSGYYGGRVDWVLMRVVDAMLAMPGILLAMAIVAILGPGLNNVMIAVGISGIPIFTRLVRGTVLAAREEVLVEAARALGATDARVMFRHILPNVIAPVIVMATLSVGTAILNGSGLSFLGLGAQPPTPEWGSMVNDGRNYLAQAWWISTMPGIAIMITVIAINLLGDGLRDVLDPSLRL